MGLGLKGVALLAALSVAPVAGCKSEATERCERTAPEPDRCGDSDYRECERLAQEMRVVMLQMMSWLGSEGEKTAHIPDKAAGMEREQCLSGE